MSHIKAPKFNINDEVFYWNGNGYEVCLRHSVIVNFYFDGLKNFYEYKVKGIDNCYRFDEFSLFKTKEEAFESVKICEMNK